ncbi:hypothetical protein [Pseudomonas sp. CGJS7]|uniref:hypothetical protein n=1 Tax=Pseudomonas sp. CGJS7 TaxID=3109348 RepID=UPI003008DF1B
MTNPVDAEKHPANYPGKRAISRCGAISLALSGDNAGVRNIFPAEIMLHRSILIETLLPDIIFAAKTGKNPKARRAKAFASNPGPRRVIAVSSQM